MPTTFPSPFPAHQGLVYPLVRRWPDSYDVIALSVGAAMPDFVDITFGYLLHGYFRHWFADWWYMPLYIIQPPHSMGPAYSVGIHTILWLILSTLGTFLFYQFVFQKIKAWCH